MAQYSLSVLKIPLNTEQTNSWAWSRCGYRYF